jgi:uncharacterized coiled-coil DUF342 family protein
MTKPEFQQELKKKITAGVKPSDIKKLKKSKSADDIPNSLPHNSGPPTPLLLNQLKEKQKEVESLRAKLDDSHQKLAETTEKLDNSLLARYEAVKQFGLIYEKLKQIRKELDENVQQASDELENKDETVKQLRTIQQKTQTRIRELEQDLNLAHRFIKLKKYPLPDDDKG